MLTRMLALLALACGLAASDDRVPVNVYFESLCPYCQDFITTTFADAWDKVPEIMDVTFVPWGNARAQQLSDGSWDITCQHGEDECKYNKVDACALMQSTQSQGVNFILCMETSGQDTAGCAEKTGLSADDLQQCYDDPATINEMLRLRDVTDAVEPPIRGVPTITVNGSQDPEREIRDNLIAVVCREYKGADKPANCK